MIPAIEYARPVSYYADTMIFFWAANGFLVLGAIWFLIRVIKEID